MNKQNQISRQGSQLPAQQRKDQILKAFPKFEDMLTKLNPSVAMVRYTQQNTALKCIKGDTVKLCEIKKIYNQQSALLMLEAMIHNLNNSINTYVKMTEAQVMEAAILVYEEFYFLNLAELTLIFKRMKKGTLGNISSRLDCNVILQAFAEYRLERIRAFEQIERESRKELYTPVDYGKYNKRVNAFIEKKKVNKKKKRL